MDLDLLIEIGFFAFAAGLCFAIFQALSNKMHNENTARRTISAMDETALQESGADKSEIQQIIGVLDEKVAGAMPFIGIKLARAGMKINAGTFVLIVLGVGSLAGIVATLFLLKPMGIAAILAGILVVAAAFGMAFIVLEFLVSMRVSAFDEQFGVGLEVMSSALKAGSTFVSSLKFVADSGDPPISEEFRNISNEMNLGVDIPTALDRFRDRMPSTNLFLFVVSIKVATLTGASLAPIFTTLAETITERFKLQGMINIAVAENLGQIAFLAVMPWVLIPFLASAWPEAYQDFLNSLMGQLMTGGIVIWYCFGLYLMFKAVKSIDA